MTDQTTTTIGQTVTSEAGSLRIGYTTGCAFIKVVLDLLRRYREEYPGVVLSLAEMHTSEQLDALVEGRIDLAFIRSGLVDPERVFSTIEILQEPLVAALPILHPATARVAIGLADLAQEPFIMFPRSVGTGLFDIIVGACRDAGFTPRVVQEAPQFASIIGLVSAGLGVALIPSALTQIPPRRRGLSAAARHRGFGAGVVGGASARRFRGGRRVRQDGARHKRDGPPAADGVTTPPIQKMPASRPAATSIPSSPHCSTKSRRHSPRQISGSRTARQRRPVTIVSTPRLVPVPSWPARM